MKQGVDTVKRILLVEDEALIAMNEAATLRKYGYEVITVHNGKKAIETASVEEIDLVLMDIDLGSGKMDGTEAAEIILEQKELPIVFCTSHAEKEYVDKVKKITGYGYVLKNSGEFVLIESINMAFTLFLAHRNERENRKRFSTTFNQASVGVALVNPTGRFIEVNDKFCRIIGYTKEEVLQLSIRDITEPEDLEIESTYIRQVLAGERESFSIEKRYKHKTGKPIWVQLESNVARDVKGNPVYAIAVVIDITDRKSAYSALKDSEANLRALIESTDDIIVFRDRAGKAVIYNEAFKKIVKKLFGIEAYPGIRTLDYLPEEQKKSWEEIIREVLKGTTKQLHFPFRFASGEEREYELTFNPVRKDGAIVGFSELNRDITALVQKERALRESEENFRKFFELSPDAVLLADGETGLIVRANKAAERLFDLPVDVIIGMHQSELHPHDLNTFAREEFKKVGDLLDGELPPLEIDIVSAENDVKNVEIRASAFFINKKLHILGTFRDISERKEAEKQKDFLLQELNHRVKNNLMMVSALISLKNEAIGDAVDISDLENQIDAIRMIHEKMHLTEDVSRIDVTEYINDLLSAVFSFTSGTVEIEKTIEVEYLDSKTSVPLGLIINEIATNAVKHGFSDGRGPGRFSLEFKKDSVRGQYVLNITNSGRPFPEDVNPDDPETLGLRLVRALVEQLKGGMELKRRPHPVFTIQFPVREN